MGSEERGISSNVYRNHWGRWRWLRGASLPTAEERPGGRWLWTPWEKWIESLRSGAESRDREHKREKQQSGLSSQTPEGLVSEGKRGLLWESVLVQAAETNTTDERGLNTRNLFLTVLQPWSTRLDAGSMGVWWELSLGCKWLPLISPYMAFHSFVWREFFLFL